MLGQAEIMAFLLCGMVEIDMGGYSPGSFEDIVLSAILLALAAAVIIMFLYHAVLYVRAQLYTTNRESQRKKSLSEVALLGVASRSSSSVHNAAAAMPSDGPAATAEETAAPRAQESTESLPKP